ncbi:MAG: hypothetical protein EOP11_02375 [Proteobacteria bacterium]|nr:MAG: hypothetical protein EOP11_02375 [Pseudomonadota bacterium]
MKVKYSRKIMAAAIIGGLAVIYLAALMLIPPLWSGRCGDTCERHLDSIGIWPNGITLRGFSLKSGDAKTERWELTADAIKLKPYWLKLLFGRPFFRAVQAENLKVEFTEGDGPKAGAKESPPEFHLDSFSASGASFSYHRAYRGRRGSLSFRDIWLEAKDLGTDAELIDRPSAVNLKAKMENSGAVAIGLQAHFFQADPRLTMRLELKNQNLAEVNAYFKPIDEIQLKGMLVEAATETRWMKDTLKSSVALRFRNFGVDFQGGRERSGIAAFFGDLFGRAAFREESGARYLPGYASIERLPKESPVAFALRGLKEAAMKAAQQ